MTSSAAADRYRFGEFELDVPNYELRRAGEVVRLSPQPFKALHLLVRRAGTLVTRDELHEELWGNESFVDFTAGLNFCIAQLRQALDDPAADSRYILAVPRRGYKFVAAVQPVVATEPLLPPSSSAPRWRIRFVTPTTVAIVCALVVGLVVGLASARIHTRPDIALRSVDAVERYERASAGLADASPRELIDRVRFFEEALKLEPNFPEAYAGLADAKLIIADYRVEYPPDAYAAAKAAAARAISLDDRLGHAHAVFATATMFLDWDWAAAAAHFNRAVSLAPQSARVHGLFSQYLTATGDHARAVQEAARAVDLVPGAPSARTSLGIAKFYAGRFTEAIADCRTAAELMPAFQPARFCTTAATAESTRDDGFWHERAANLLQASPEECVLRAISIASALTHTGNRGEALDWLERAANHRTDTILFAAAHPGLQPLRTEPRFMRLLQRIGRR